MTIFKKIAFGDILKVRFSAVAMTLYVTLSLYALTFAFAAEEQQKPPFTGQVKADNVNIRAGGNRNFEILCKVNKDDLLFVLDEAYGWYKIILPKWAACYVWKDFIGINNGQGFSTASNLNLRARPNKESSIIGQLAKGDAVTILNEDTQGWYQISPPKNSYGWIHAALIEPGTAKQETATKETESKKPKRRFLWW